MLRARFAEPTENALVARGSCRVAARHPHRALARAAARSRDTVLYHGVRARRGADRASLAVALAPRRRLAHAADRRDLPRPRRHDARRDAPAPTDGSSTSTNASVTRSRRKRCRRRPERDLLFTDDERQRVVSAKRGVAGSNRVSLPCRTPSPPSRRSDSHSRRTPSRGGASSPKAPAFLSSGRGRPRRAARSWLHSQRLRFGLSPLDHGQPVASLEPGDGIE